MKKVTLLMIFIVAYLFSFGQWQSNFGIGIESPQYKLDVDGNINISSGHSFLIDGVPLSNGAGVWNAFENNIYFNSGNVGIGIENPEWNLHIVGQAGIDFIDPSDGGGRFHLNRPNQNYESMISFNTAGDYNWLLGLDNYGTNDLKLWRSPGIHIMTISNETGNIGINSENPAEKLEVNGNILIKDNNALILTSPNGTEFEITVDDYGNLITTTTTKINSGNSNMNIEIFPNPTKNHLTVKINEQSVQEIRAEIYDLSGNMLFMKNYKSNSIQINTTNLTSSAYVLKLKDSDGNLIKTEKIIKK